MTKLDKQSVIGISALLVHAANIDEIYSDHEKDLVRDFIKSYLKATLSKTLFTKLGFSFLLTFLKPKFSIFFFSNNKQAASLVETFKEVQICFSDFFAS